MPDEMVENFDEHSRCISTALYTVFKQSSGKLFCTPVQFGSGQFNTLEFILVHIIYTTIKVLYILVKSKVYRVVAIKMYRIKKCNRGQNGQNWRFLGFSNEM